MTTLVLIVEDNRDHRVMMRQAMGSLGWRTAVASGVREAYEKTLSLRPQLVITDIRLADLTGFDLCRMIKSHPKLQETPVMMVTGKYVQEEDRLWASEMGANAYLLKPIHIRDLLDTAHFLVRPPDR